jgi:hypothetical protein
MCSFLVGCVQLKEPLSPRLPGAAFEQEITMLPRVALLVALAALSTVPASSSAQPAKEPEVSTRGPAAARPGLEALKRAQFLAVHGHDAALPSVSASAPKAPPLTTSRPLSETERAAREAWFAAHPAPTMKKLGRSSFAPRAWTPPASAKRPVLPAATIGPPDPAPLDALRRAKLARAQAPASEK